MLENRSMMDEVAHRQKGSIRSVVTDSSRQSFGGLARAGNQWGTSDSIEIGKWDVDELLIEAGQLSSRDSDPFDSRLAGWSG
jgi:hypothetical protein